MPDAASVLAAAVAERHQAELALDAHRDACGNGLLDCADCKSLARHAERCARQVALLQLTQAESEALF
jgi:hypothetical protein